MIQNKIRLTSFIVPLFVPIVLIGQPRIEKSINSSLFTNESLLNMTLEMDVNTVIKDIEEIDAHPAILRYTTSDIGEHKINLKVKTRGETRKNPKVCRFPPIELNFKKKQNYDNIFTGQDKLKLVTHCGKSKVYDQYILQEYLTYKHYNILTEKSFKVRLLKVKYVDSAGDNKPLERFGFLIEDKSVMAKRNGMKVTKRKLLNQDFCDRVSLDLMTVFQYMIGNTDWSITSLHNIKVITLDSASKPIPVPYDFDYSGAISTHYAQPPEILPINTVRQRIYRGFCRKTDELNRTFDIYNQHKNEIYDLYQNSEFISEKNKKRIIKYFDEFYKTINDPKRSKKAFNGACRLNHVHLK